MPLDLNKIIQDSTGGFAGPSSSMYDTGAAYNTPGAMQYQDGGSASMMPPTGPGTFNTATEPTIAEITGGTGAPSISDELNRIKNEALNIQGMIPGAFNAPTPDNTEIPYWQPLTPQEERRIQRNQMRLFQKEIDATNQIYNNMLQSAQFEGQGRLGSQRAISARSGLLGSDFGASQKEEVLGQNRSIERGIQDERQLKIATIMGKARQSAVDEIAAKNKANKEGADAKIAYLASKAERRSKNLGTLASALVTQGVDPSTLSPEELNALVEGYGVKKEDIIASYADAKAAADSAALEGRKTEAEIKKIEADIASGKLIQLGEGEMLYNPETGETFKNPKTYAPGTGSGSLANIDPEALQSIRDNLESKRGTDKYTDTAEYFNEYQAFVTAGGTPEQFVKAFDPDKYINPADPTRSWLDSQMRKQQSIDPIDAAIAARMAQINITPATEPE